MPDELITPENVTKEMLKDVFDAAFMESSFDKEGDLVVRDDVNCYVLLSEKKDRIALLTMFGFEDGVSELKRLQCVNNINARYIMIRAVSGANNILRFEYDIMLNGGVSRKALVLTVKRFCAIPRSAVSDFGADIVR